MIYQQSQVESLRKNLLGKKTVLVGGCFDVLHPGHIVFLEKAQQVADCLIILLESDQRIKQLKGVNRPVHNQADRAQVLSSLRSVDEVLLLNDQLTNQEYEQLIRILNPQVIALTRGVEDEHHKRIAQLVGAKLEYVTDLIGDYSTTKILTHPA